LPLFYGLLETSLCSLPIAVRLLTSYRSKNHGVSYHKYADEPSFILPRVLTTQLMDWLFCLCVRQYGLRLNTNNSDARSPATGYRITHGPQYPLPRSSSGSRLDESTIGVARNLCWGADHRGAEGAKIETPKASSGKGMGQPIRGGLGSVVSSPSVVRGGAPAENEFWSI